MKKNDCDIAVLAKKTQVENGDNVDIVTELDSANLQNFYDVEFYDVNYDVTTMKDGANVDFQFGVINNGSNKIDQLYIEMQDDVGNCVYSGFVSQEIAIGENKVIEQSIKMPDQLANKYTVSITAASDNQTLEEQNSKDNSKEIEVKQSNLEISANKRIFKDKDEANITVKNTGNIAATAKISLINDNEKVVYEKKIGSIPAGESLTSNIPIEEAYFSENVNYGEDEVFTFVVSVEDGEKNANEYDNSVSMVFEKKTYTRLELVNSSKEMKAGETSQIELVNQMPEEVHYSSKNEKVATVDDAGNIRAVGAGKTTISVCSGAQRSVLELNVVPIETSQNVEVKYEGASVTLSDMIGVNFYVTLSDDDLNNHNAYMKFKLADGTVKKVKVSEAEAYNGKNNTRIFTCKMAAAQMSDEIKAQLIIPEADGKERSSETLTYSVKQYCQYILKNADSFDSNTQVIVKKILNYGAYSQLYFNYNCNDLANNILPEEDRILTKKDDLVAGSSTYQIHNIGGLKYYGMSLILESNTTMRFYFEITDADKSISDYKFQYADKILKPVKAGGFYYVDIPDITPGEYGKVFTLKVAEQEFASSSVYDYCRKVLKTNNTNDKLKDLAIAMYELGLSVK